MSVHQLETVDAIVRFDHDALRAGRRFRYN